MRRALGVTVAAVFLLFGTLEANAQPKASPPKPTTYTYKKVGDLEIKADVYRPADERVRPVVVWIHGGGMINGNRESIVPLWRDELVRRGYVLVSIDYRLAPESKLPELVSDIEDAFRWVREHGPKLFHADPGRLAVAGASAGGYLTLVSGFRVQPRPKALVALYGYGDLLGPWAAGPSPFPRHQSKLTREEAHALITGKPVSDPRNRKGNGGAFYLYCRHSGDWPQEVSGWDPKTEAAKYTPYLPVKNVTADYPPTMLIHGTVDTDVPYDQSLQMAAELKKHGVEHQLVSLEGAEHGFGGGDPKAVAEANQAGLDFIERHVPVNP